MQPLIWGFRFTREIARRMPHFRGEPPVFYPAFAPGGLASVLAHAYGPVPFDVPHIVYLEEDERALEVSCVRRVCSFSTSLFLLTIHSLSCAGAAVASVLHSVSSAIDNVFDAHLCVCVYGCRLAWHVRDEAARARRRR